MKREHGTLPQVARNLAGPGWPLAERIRLAARNALRRLGPPPRDCCGHHGEPGC